MNQAEVVAAQLVQEGAILTLEESGTPFLVGHLVWLGRGRLFWFTANGDDPEKDGQLLLFETAKAEGLLEITFWTKKRLVARLTSLDSPAVREATDVEDQRAAWRVWQQRRPACERLIGASLTHHVTRC
jgi:hypothetical protein